MTKVSIVILSLCFLFTTQTRPPVNFLRLLSDIQSTREKSCKNIPNEYEGIKGFDTLNGYVESLDIGQSKGQDFLLNILIKGNTEGLTDFLKDIGVYIAMIALAAIVVVIWPIMCCCCCCSCCIFSKKKKAGCCGLTHLIISLCLIGGIIIVSIISLSQSRTFVQNFNGSICSLFTFFQNAILGEEGDKVPRWGGAKGISDSLTKSIESIKTIKSSYTVGTLPKGQISTDLTTYDGKITGMKNNYQVPNPETTTNENTKYTPEFKNEAIETTYLGQIVVEKKTVIDNSLSVLTQLDKAIGNINSSAGFENTIDLLAKLLLEFNNLLSSITDILGENIINVQTIASDILLLAFDILYGIFLAIAVACFAILLVYMLCKCYCLKIFLHIFWNVIFLLTILSFIVGALLGIIGAIGSQINPVINHVLSPEFMTGPDSPFGSKDQAKVLDTCINGDGEILNALDMNNNADSKLLDELVTITVAIDNIKSDLKPDSVAVASIKTKMTEFQKNIDSTLDSYKTVLDQINKDLTDCSVPDRFYVSGQTSSPGWIEIIKTTTTTITCQPGSDTMAQRITNVASSVEKNQDNIKVIIDALDVLKTDYAALMVLIQADFTTAKSLTSALYDTYGGIIGGNNLFSMFNCKFLRYELMNFFDQLGNKFASSSRMIGICCLVCSFASFVGIFFIMSTIYYYTEDARKEAKSE